MVHRNYIYSNTTGCVICQEFLLIYYFNPKIVGIKKREKHRFKACKSNNLKSWTNEFKKKIIINGLFFSLFDNF